MSAASTYAHVDAPSSWPKDARPPVAAYTPSMWGDIFTSFCLDDQVQDKYAEAIEPLKDQARSFLMAKGNTKRDKLVLIDTLERLGVAYHFEQEIDEQLDEIFKLHSSELHDSFDDLFAVALQFRLLRQHRHRYPSSIFDMFTGEDNKFKDSLSTDVEGLLSLYEAAHTRIHGEEILEEAATFTTHHLNRMVEQLQSPLQDQVKRALEQSLHRGVPRIETRHYISLYEKDDSKNEVLLKLAKLDFNYLQNMYKKELYELSRWWKELDLQPKLPFARDRVVECHFWGMAFHFEPQYSDARIAAAKCLQMLTVMNDTYDNYATLEEADIFTQSLERWNIDEIDQLPDYMKTIYKFILSMYDDYDYKAAKQGKLFAVPYAKETVKQIAKAYNKDIKWKRERQMPAFEDYIANTMITSCLYVIPLAMIPGMKSVTKETIDWLMSEPDILVASAKVCRYLDDVGSHERENQQGQVMTAVEWYMNKHRLSMQETVDKFFELAEDAWKDLNAEWMAKTSNKEIEEFILNYARVSELMYRNCQDRFANAEVLAPQLAAVYVDPVVI